MDLPDFEADPNLGAVATAPFLGDGWKTVQPGDQNYEPSPASAPEDSFPPEIEQELRGLLYLGSLQKSFPFLGHDIVMRTLTTGEELACTLVIKEYEESLGHAKALATAFVGASIVTVDGLRLAEPLGPEGAMDALRARFQQCIRWYWPVVESLYSYYSSLTLRQAKIFEELESKLHAGRDTA